MPEVIVHCAAGRTAEQKKGLCQDITAAVVNNFGAPIDAVVVQIVEAPLDSKSKGGIMFTDRMRAVQPDKPAS